MSRAERFINILNTSNDGLWYQDEDGNVEFYSESFYQSFDIHLNNSTFDDWLKLVHPLDVEKLSSAAKKQQSSQSSERVVTRYRVRDKQGNYRWIEGLGINVEVGSQKYMVGLHKDVSDEVLMTEYLVHEASHDSETNFLNRRQFERDMRELAPDSVVVTCCFDPAINRVTRTREDVFLGQIASNLISAFDEVVHGDYELYRVNSNTFVAIIPDQKGLEKNLPGLVIKLDAIYLQSSQKNSQWINNKGVYFSPLSGQEFIGKEPLDYIMQVSDYALFKKSNYSCRDDMSVELHRHAFVYENIVEAIRAGEITIDLQPIVDELGTIVSFETLARWPTEEFGFISPVEFIPVAESQDAIHQLGLSVVKSACIFLNQYDLIEDSKPLINVNVSVKQLLNKTFAQDVVDIVVETGLSPSRIVLEITESYILDDNVDVMSQTALLAQLGFNISIDDFGSGYSSITSIYRLPLYQIKLDKGLVWQSLQSPSCREFVEYIAEFGKKHNISIVAEGIESQSMMQEIMAMKVSHFQGYYIHEPKHASTFLKK